MEDPVHLQAMEKYDQDLLYMSSEDYAKFARRRCGGTSDDDRGCRHAEVRSAGPREVICPRGQTLRSDVRQGS